MAAPSDPATRVPGPWKTVHVTTVDVTAWCFLRTWFARLRREGHEVILITSPGPFTDRLRAEGVRVIHVPMERRIHPWRDLMSVSRLVGVLRREKPDVVHTHTSKAGFLGRLAARLAGVPRVVHTMHEPPHNAATGVLRWLYIVLEKIAARWADHVVTVSYANEQEIRRQDLVPLDRLSVIREGLDLSRYPRLADPRQRLRELGFADGVPVVGTVGRLETAKGHLYLLQAAQIVTARRPDVRFVIVGDGVLRSDLQAQARRLGVDGQVLFAGYREDMLELIQGFDVFVLPSLWEGLGIVLLEAMAYGRPVVASSVGGVRDVVVEEETGILVPPRSPEALADAILRMLDDPAAAAEMARAGHQRLVREFRDDVANERMMGLYRRLLDR